MRVLGLVVVQDENHPLLPLTAVSRCPYDIVLRADL